MQIYSKLLPVRKKQQPQTKGEIDNGYKRETEEMRKPNGQYNSIKDAPTH